MNRNQKLAIKFIKNREAAEKADKQFRKAVAQTADKPSK